MQVNVRNASLQLIFVVCAIGPFVLASENPGVALPDAPSAAVANGVTAAVTPAEALETGNASAAQSSRDDESRGPACYWVRRVLRDQADIYTSPFHASAIKWDIGLPVAILTLVVADEHISDNVPKSPGAVSTNISTGGLVGLEGVTGLLFLDGVLNHNPHAEETGILGAESFVNSAGVYAVVQLITGRDRPLQDSREGYFFQHTSVWGNSFPSGHSTFSWAAASTLAHEYPKGWVKWLAYGTATAVSVTRVTSGQHFTGDVVAGGTIGYLVARHVFHAHCKNGLSEVCSAK
jgi:membrane-associated phospholipid phosphatase